MLLKIFIFVILLFAFDQKVSAHECPNSNPILTPALRTQILNHLNNKRNLLLNGQLLLENGKHALRPTYMPSLNWNCETEAEMLELARGLCQTGIIPTENFTWYSTTADQTHAEVVSAGLYSVDMSISGYYANYLSEHSIFAGPTPWNVISVLHDKAETVGCALLDCYHYDDQTSDGPIPDMPQPTFIMQYIFCQITPDVQFGEQVYEIDINYSSPNFPSQDVICLEVYGIQISMRQMILEKINDIRQQIQKGTFVLENGNNALQAVNLNDLEWDCEEEAAVYASTTLLGSCTNTYPDTIFQAIFVYNWATYDHHSLYNSVSDYFDELFTLNPSLNFLSQSTVYSTQYPPALALSDQASTIACAANVCLDQGIHKINFVCRAKPSAQINDQLYQI